MIEDLKEARGLEIDRVVETPKAPKKSTATWRSWPSPPSDAPQVRTKSPPSAWRSRRSRPPSTTPRSSPGCSVDPSFPRSMTTPSKTSLVHPPPTGRDPLKIASSMPRPNLGRRRLGAPPRRRMHHLRSQRRRPAGRRRPRPGPANEQRLPLIHRPAEAAGLHAGRRPRVEGADRGRFGLDPGSRCHDFHRAC